MQNKNNVEKKMSAKDDMSLAKDIKDIEFDVMQDLADSIKADFLKERSEGQSFTDWLQTKPDSYFERLSLKEGGSTVISFSEYAKKKPKIKKINLADHFKLNQTVADLSDADVELVNRLLKMSLGKED
jgi:hypothetical protein|tara:strand:+ start:89 stop:472 length:384 start_codon:yes stop_codon:yes gene_type:complete